LNTKIDGRTNQPVGRMPRWKRLQRALLLTLLAAVVAYFGGIFLAGAWMKHDLAALEDLIRAKGEPVTLEELDSFYPEVPDAENAALRYLKAGEVLANFHDEQAYDPHRSNLESDLKGNDHTYETLTQLKDYITERKPVFIILDEALQLDKARYPVDLSKLPKDFAAAYRTLRDIDRLLWLRGLNALHADDWDTLVRAEQNLIHLASSLAQVPDGGFQLQAQWCKGKANDLVVWTIRTQRAPTSTYKALDPLYAEIDSRRSMRINTLADRVLFAARVDAFYQNNPTLFREDDISLFKKYKPYRSIPGFQTWGIIEKRNGMRFYTEMLDDGEKPWPIIFAGTVERNSFAKPFRFLESIAEKLDLVDLEHYEPNDHSIFRIDGETIIRLTRIAMRVDAHRADRGAYPNSLDELEWTIHQEIATGPYFDNPFGYRKTENGFALFDDSITPEHYSGMYANQGEIEFVRETPPLPMKPADPKPAPGTLPSQFPGVRNSS